MESIKNFFVGTFGFFGLILMWVLAILIPVGDIYWLWMAIQIGNFWMFLLGLIPPIALFTGPVGAYSLLFGMPDWLINLVL